MADIAAGRLAHAPVVFVLAAIRFEPLEALPNWIVEIHEELRPKMPSFRRFRQTVALQGMEIAIDPPDFRPDDPGACWVLSTVDAKTTVQFSKSSLVIHTSDYSTFKDFGKTVSLALEALMSRARQINVNHIGIRYVDHLRVMSGMGIDKFVFDELKPHVPSLEGLVVASGISVTTYTHGSDLLNVRFSSGVGMPVIPEDLISSYVSTIRPTAGAQLTFPTMQANEGVLDTDCVAQNLGGAVLTPAQIHEILDRLHTTANSYFRAVTTKEANEVWSGANGGGGE